MSTLSNTLRMYAFATGQGDLGEPVIENDAKLPVALPFSLTEEYVYAPAGNPGVLWLTEELSVDEANAYGTAVLPFNLPAELASDAISSPIPGTITTRRYSFGTMDKKRFRKVALDVVLYNASAAEVLINTRNPDMTTKLQEFDTASQQDYVRRIRVAKQGFSADLTLNTLSGRASIRGASLEAVVPGSNIVSEK